MTTTNKLEVEETPFGWWVLCKNSESFFLKNRRESGFGPTDAGLKMFAESIIPLYVEKKKEIVPHIHHDVIVAFANGHAVQWQDSATKKWYDIIDPIFIRNINYRIKPE